MAKSLVAVQKDRDGVIELVELDLSAPAPHEVQVRIEASGVCQSQLMWMGLDRAAPVLFGHEGYGHVEATGSDVEGLAPGDRVLVTWLPRIMDRPVDRCGLTLPDGTRALSPNVYTWATRVVVDEAYVRALPVGVDNPNTCIVGCAVITGAGAVLNVGNVCEGYDVVVIGAGGVGISAIAGARYRGAGRIVAVDLDDDKLELARKFGATHTVNASNGNTVQAVRDVLEAGADTVFDCVAAPATITDAIGMLRAARPGHAERGGTAVVVGVPKNPVEINVLAMMYAGTTLTSTLAGSCAQEQIDEFLNWWRQGDLDLDALVTDTYTFADIEQATRALAQGQVLGRAIVLMDKGLDNG